MSSKIIITKSSGRKSVKSRSSKISSPSIKRSSKSKFQDIELGSTIGEIYRKSRSKSVFNNKNVSRVTNSNPQSNCNNYLVHDKKDTVLKKQIFLNNTFESGNKYNKPQVKTTIKPQVNTPIKPKTKTTIKPQVKTPIKPKTKTTTIKTITISKATPDVNNLKASPQKRASPQKKASPQKRASPHKSTSPHKRTSPQKRASPHKKASPHKTMLSNNKVVNEYEHNYKEIFVRTNLNSFEEIPKLVYPEIIDKIDIIENNFTQFTDVADKYIMAMISGGIDIKKCKK